MFISKWFTRDLTSIPWYFPTKGRTYLGCLLGAVLWENESYKALLMSTSKSSSFWSMSQVASIEDVARWGWFIAFSHMHYLTTWNALGTSLTFIHSLLCKFSCEGSVCRAKRLHSIVWRCYCLYSSQGAFAFEIGLLCLPKVCGLESLKTKSWTVKELKRFVLQVISITNNLTAWLIVCSHKESIFKGYFVFCSSKLIWKHFSELNHDPDLFLNTESRVRWCFH